MPNIEQYDSEVSPEATINTERASGISGVGSGLQAFGQGVETLGKGLTEFQSRKEIAQNYKGISDTQTNAVAQIKNLNKSLSDEEITQFMAQNFETPIQNMRDNTLTATGSDTLEKQSDYTKKYVFGALLAKNSVLKSAEIDAGAQDIAQKQGQLLMENPSAATFDHANTIYSNYVNDSMSPVKGSAESQMVLKKQQNTWALNWFSGVLDKQGPEAAQKLKDSGQLDNYLGYGKQNGKKDDDVWMDGQIAMGRKAVQAQQAQAEMARKKAQAVKDTALEDTFLRGLVPQDPNDPNPIPPTTAKAILSSDISDPGKKMALVRFVEAQAKGTDATDPALFNRLQQRIHLPDNDHDQLNNMQELQKYAGNGLGSAKFAQLRKEMLDRTTDSGNNEAKLKQSVLQTAKDTLIQTTMGIKDPNQEMNYYAASEALNNAYSQGRQRGLTPEQLTVPYIGGKTNPDYIGHLIPLFKKTPQQAAQEQLNARPGSPVTALSSQDRLTQTLGIKYGVIPSPGPYNPAEIKFQSPNLANTPSPNQPQVTDTNPHPSPTMHEVTTTQSSAIQISSKGEVIKATPPKDVSEVQIGQKWLGRPYLGGPKNKPSSWGPRE